MPKATPPDICRGADGRGRAEVAAELGKLAQGGLVDICRGTAGSSNGRGRAGRASGPSVVVELVETLVVDAGVVGEFVDDRDAYFLSEVVGIGEVSLQRQSEE